LKFKPFSSDTVYATSNSEFYISTDGGTTWNPGFNDFQFTDVNMGELLLGVTQAAPEYVYIASQQDCGNIYKSTDGGVTFTAMKKHTAPGLIGYDIQLFSYGQGAYDFTFSADPLDSLKLYIGSISLYESNDGGVTWPTPYFSWSVYSHNFKVHCDQHFVARNPLLPDRIWVANDGGVYMKPVNDTLYYAKQHNLAVTQAYHFDAENVYDSSFAYGTQDNGASFTNNGSDFFVYKEGDVFAKIYSLYNNSAVIFTAGANNAAGATNIDLHAPAVSYPLNIPDANAYEPMSLTPLAPLTGFLAHTHIWESNDLNGSPANWRQIFINSTPRLFVAANHCLADSNTFYAVRDDGYLFRTFDALTIQPVFDSVLLPTANPWQVTLATVPGQANVIYMSTDSIYKSVDRGLNWTNITGTISALYGFNEIVADPFANDGSIYLAATNKIYYKNDTTSDWVNFSNQLPDVTNILDIAVKKFSSQVRKVMASPLCRGIWQSPVYQNLVSKVPELKEEEIVLTVFPNPASSYVTVESTLPENKIRQIFIYNEQGQQVSSTRNNVNKSKVILPLNMLADGFYLIEIVTDLGAVTKRITVHK